MTIFRPCIDIHNSTVKQIVGGTLSSAPPSSTSSSTFPETLKTNFISPHPPSHFADLYRAHDLQGGHVIMLGPGNEDVAREALRAWPGGMQVGGGIKGGNVTEREKVGRWVREWGGSKVIVTSYLFPSGHFSQPRLDEILAALDGDKDKLVIDLSCRRDPSSREEKWFVAMDKWQTITDMEVCQESIHLLEPHCSEFLIHAADKEGLQAGIDEALVRKLGQWCSIPVTYAGGGKTLADLEKVKELSGGKVDLTIGSALDIFGGQGVKFEEVVEWNRRELGLVS